LERIIRRTKRATKILTEFELKNNEKLRIYVDIWGDREYAKKLGYYGNIVYKPVLVNKDGFENIIYKHKMGLPTLEELKRLFQDWNDKLERGSDTLRLKQVATSLYELAEIKTFFDERKAHVIYNLLRITRGGPTFKIVKPEDIENLSIEIIPVINVSFRGNESFRFIQPYISATKFFEALKLLSSYDQEIERIANELKWDLSRLAGSDGPVINLDVIADYVNEQLQKVFEKESLQ